MTVITSPVWINVRMPERSDDRSSVATTAVVPASSGWYWSAVRTLDELAALPIDWDGDGSPAPDPRVLGVLRVLGGLRHPQTPEPDVVPDAGGGVALYWTYQGRRLELHFMSPEELSALRVTPDGLVQETLSPSTPAHAQRYVDWLLTGRDWL
jgi:hypothetical protein